MGMPDIDRIKSLPSKESVVYVIKNRIKGREYFYLCKSIRDGKKICRKTVCYLGPASFQCSSIAGALRYWKNKLLRNQSEQEKIIAKIRELESKVDEDFSFVDCKIEIRKLGKALPNLCQNAMSIKKRIQILSRIH